MASHYQDNPTNPCKRRCTKGLGSDLDGDQTTTSSPASSQPPSSSQHSTDSSQQSQPDQDAPKTQQTDDDMQHTSSAPQHQEDLNSAQPAYPLQNDLASAGDPMTTHDYNPWNSVALKEFEDKLQQAAAEEAKQGSPNGSVESDATVDGDGLNGNGLNGNGLNGSGVHQFGENGTLPPSPFLQHQSQPSPPPQIKPPSQQPTEGLRNGGVSPIPSNGFGPVNGNGYSDNGVHRYGENGLYPANQFTQHFPPSPQPQSRPASRNQHQNSSTPKFEPISDNYTETANRWNEDFYNSNRSRFGGTSAPGSVYGGANNGVYNGTGVVNGNGVHNGAGGTNGQQVYWNGSHPGTPTQYNSRQILPHLGSQPPTPPPFDRRIKTEQKYTPQHNGTWRTPGSISQHGNGTPPPGFYRPQIKSEHIKTEYTSSECIKSEPNGNVNGNGGFAPPPPNGTGAPSANKRVIDLTQDDDDDCVVVGQTKTIMPPRPLMQRGYCPRPPGEVCYGMIKHATVNAHRVPTPRPGQDRFPGRWPPIPVCFCRVAAGCTLAIRAVDCTRVEFGCLELGTARGLAHLMDNKLVRLQPRIYPRSKEPGEIAGGDFPGGPKQLMVYINVYGQERMAGYVGGYLREKGIELIHPSQPDDLPIFNPHDPRNAAMLRLGTHGMVNGLNLVAPTPTNIQTVTKTQESIKNDVIEVLNHLERWKDLPEMEQDEKIVTPLLPHQKIGLAFMTARESDQDHDGKGGSLWKHHIREVDKRHSWTNIITEDVLEDEPPPPAYGGILADVMGLGKTLSILSLIASTTDKAAEYETLPKFEGTNKNLVTPVKTTLLISPLSTISNWEEQIKQHVKPGTMTFYVYHGGKRQTDIEMLKGYDLIITTYQIIAGEMAKFKKNGTKTLFGELSFFRIVLDEAHMIREQSTAQFKGVVAIEGQRRWAVTGTPIQNRLDDLHALIAFVRVSPFDQKAVFKNYIATPFKTSDPVCLERVRTLVDSITLRRQKDKINLPPRVDHIITLKMTENEREIYEATHRQSKFRMDMVQKSGTLSGNAYVHVLKSILRLRLICAHGRELLGEDDTAGLTSSDAIDVDELEEKHVGMPAKQAYEIFKLMKESGADDCALCGTKVESQPENQSACMKGVTIGFLTPCAHLLCKNGCAETYKSSISDDFSVQNQAPCYICSHMIRLDLFELKEGGAAELESNEKQKTGKKEVKYRGPSTKVRALIASLTENRTESTPEEPVKSVVFSCWTSHMDLIGKAFNDHGISFVRLDGSMSRAQRNEVIEQFRQDPKIEVIIISIAAGGLGLNLTCAQKVYVMEPQFNPAAEAQAIDRVHRLGQKKTVTTTRYIMEDSFEDKILELQRKKTDLANLSMTGKLTNKAALTKQRLSDLASLFK